MHKKQPNILQTLQALKSMFNFKMPEGESELAEIQKKKIQQKKATSNSKSKSNSSL